MNRRIFLILITAALALAAGCVAFTEVTTEMMVLTGRMTPEQRESAIRVAEASSKAMEDINPEQEYWVGRSVAATILKQYKVYDQQAATEYVNLIGQSLAMFSDKPETFKGYHFAILNTDEINAFAAPGGTIMVTRGLLKCCKDEDAIAAVLAHEIGHVQFRHGIQQISNSRWTSVGTTAFGEGLKNLTGENGTKVMNLFGGTIDDITQTFFGKGYSRKYEYQADAMAITILKRVGYNPAALKNMLLEMNKTWNPSGMGFMKTHPSPMDRIGEIEPLIQGTLVTPASPARLARFQKAMTGI